MNYLISGGVNYLVVQGTTGESVTLTKEEKKETLAFCIDEIAGRVPVVFGLGGNNTMEVLTLFSEYNFDGVDALLSVVHIIINLHKMESINITKLLQKNRHYQ